MIADTGNNAIRHVVASTMTTIANEGFTGGFSGDPGPAATSLLLQPQGAGVMTVNGATEFLFADSGNHRVR